MSPPVIILLASLVAQAHRYLVVAEGRGCYRQALITRKLQNRYIRLSKTTNNLADCESLCTRELSFTCKGFSYRAPQSAGEVLNCDLTDQDTTTLDTYTDFYPNTNTYFYERSGTGADCRTASAIGSKCYKLFKSSTKHYTYRDYKTSTSVEGCAEECRRTSWCNSISYRYSYNSATDIGNCLLSDTGVEDLRDPEDLVKDSSWDIYRVNRGSSCSGNGNPYPPTSRPTRPADCAESARAGYRHFSTRPQDKLRASTLYECGELCRQEKYCNSFSYSQSGRDCYLSTLRVEELQTRDIARDSSWDIFRPLFGGSCGSGGGGGYYPDRPYNPGQGTQRPSDNTPPQRPTDNRPLAPDSPSGCFRIYEARYRLERSAARESVSARDLRDCEEKCEREHLFTCRSFSFTSDYMARNCDLSELGARDLSLGRDLVRDQYSDVYEKITSGTCGSGSGGGNYIHDYIRCSNFAEPEYRLSYGITRELTSARDSADCEEQCLLATRYSCKIFAYKYGSSGSKNCELSDRDLRDIRVSSDLDRDRDWDVFERTRYSGECRDQSSIHDNGDSVIIDRLSCYTKYRSDTSFRSRAVVERRSARDEEECARECDYYRGSGQYQCNAFSYRRNYGSNADNCVLSDSYGRDIDVDLTYERDYDVYEFSGRGPHCRNDNDIDSAGEYTVNGQRCLRGGCRLNPDVNYWYCEVAEDRGWDYCCRPEHRCGYSEGFSYPWCFVGEAGYDQWRPCDSERARIGDRGSGYDPYGRPLYSYLHEASPPKRYDHQYQHHRPEGRVDEVPAVPKVPFNSDDIPFISINEHRIDNTNFAPGKDEARHRPVSRRSGDNAEQENIEDNFISNAKVVEIDPNDGRINSKMLPFFSWLHASNATLH